MGTSKPPQPPADLATLAAEALELWEEHLALSASDPEAKAAMMQMLEPSRRMFADWTAMMQNAPHANAAAEKPQSSAHGAPAAGPASDDGALRLAQLAHRMAELEKRLDALESGLAGKAAKTPRASAGRKSRV